MRRGTLHLLALVLVLLPTATAAETVPVLVERVDAGGLAADVGQPAVANFSLFNLNPDESFYVSVAVEGPTGWDATPLDDKFFLQPGETRYVEVRFVPHASPRNGEDFTVTFSIVHRATGDVTKIPETVEVASAAPPRVLDVFPNPLPPPLDNVYGTFLLDVLFWVGVAVAAIFAGDILVRVVTQRASNRVTREILLKVRKPIFYFVFLLGIARSFAVLPRNFFTEILMELLLATAVAVFGLYALYRILDSALLYYQKEISPRTDTKVDDILIPVVRKVGIVVLYVVGAVITLQNIGWDPTLVFAGAGIAGLVIAFAAQDTFSNLFSGLFLLLDRPFREGDDIQLETGEIVRVDHIGLRTTRLFHPRNHESVVVPNNQLATRRIVNLSAPDMHYWVMIDVGATYSADPRKVEKVLLDVARNHPLVLKEDPWAPLVLFAKFGESSLDFVLRFAVEDYRQRFAIASDVRFAIKKAFDENGIEIPFPQRTLWLKEAPRLRVEAAGGTSVSVNPHRSD